MVQWGLLAGVALGARASSRSRAVYVPLFTADPDVRALLVAALLVVAVMPAARGVVFVLDGVLIGAGDGRYLALASVLSVLALLPAALAVALVASQVRRTGWRCGRRSAC